MMMVILWCCWTLVVLVVLGLSNLGSRKIGPWTVGSLTVRPWPNLPRTLKLGTVSIEQYWWYFCDLLLKPPAQRCAYVLVASVCVAAVDFTCCVLSFVIKARQKLVWIRPTVASLGHNLVQKCWFWFRDDFRWRFNGLMIFNAVQFQQMISHERMINYHWNKSSMFHFLTCQRPIRIWYGLKRGNTEGQKGITNWQIS